MTDPLLPFLALNVAALLLIGGLGPILPRAIGSVCATGLCGLGVLLCLAPLIFQAPATALVLPAGPPGLALHLALDPVAAVFLLAVFGCGTAVCGFHATGADPSERTVPLALAGLVLIPLAADVASLALGLSLVAAASGRRAAGQMIPLVMAVLAICLLGLAGAGPAAGAAVLATAASLWLVRGWTGHPALLAGAIIPVSLSIALRLLPDPQGGAAAWWGFVLLPVAGAACVVDAWQATRDPALAGSVSCLARRQWGLAMTGLALTLIARAADLPDAGALGLAATLLLVLVSAVAGTTAALAARAMTDQAGTGRLDRLGGLIRGMPAASAALAASLLALSAVPPAADFAAVWLLFQAILSAPRTGGLVAQLPLALSAAALAFSAALATAACLRLIGVAVLSRPRGVRASAADDVAPPRRWVLLAPAAAGLLIGVLPGPVLRLLADPAIRDLTGAGLRGRVGWTGLAGSAASQGYDPLPLLVLLAVAAVAVSRLVRRRETRVTAGWTGGAAPSRTLPFGEPLAQSAGLGFAPTLPDLPALRLPGGWTPPRLRVPAIGLWVLLLGFGALLLSLAGTGG